MVALLLPLSGCKPRPTPADVRRGRDLDKLLSTKPDPQWIGKTGTLYGLTAKDGQVQPNVGFARTWEDYDAFMAASLAMNYDKAKEMVAQGKMLGVLSGEVQAVLLESRTTRGPEPTEAVRVKMLSGPYKDQTVWICAPSFRVTP